MTTAAGAGRSAADHARIKALFDAVADLPDEAACRAHLAHLGASDADSARVMALVAQDRSAVTRVSAPLAAAMAGAAAAELKPGDRLGPWRLEAELGQGGMGHVFGAARADGLYEQRVAIKLLRGQPGEAGLAQLARERRILASLNHPHIARLLDGGTTPLGRPYLVMEFVQGLRVDTWCEQQQLGMVQRLALFDQVARAVAHAHRQLVVHCDIKPANVLVGPDDRAMLLDFGIAQLQGVEGNDTASMTPRYARPEQRAGLQASAVSDVYSLGRLLDELLSAAPDAAGRADEWRAIVARACAELPQHRYPTVDALQADLQRLQRHQPLQALPPALAYRGRKLVRRRWPLLLAGVAALALSTAFVLRLAQERDRAVQAEATARAQQRAAEQARAEALTQRDRATAAGAEAQRERDAARLAAEQARAAEQRALAETARADAARREAQAQADTTAQVSDFMVSIFEGADPKHGGRPDLPAAALVDKGRDRIDTQLRDQPALQSAMKGTLARVYENLGRNAEAAQLYGQAVALEGAAQLNRPLKEAELLSRQAILLANSGRHADAVAPARRALALRAARLPTGDLEMADAHNTLGWVLARNDQHDEARRQLQRAIDIRRARQGGQHLDLAGSLHNLGMLEQRADRAEAALGHLRTALVIKQAQLPPQHPIVLNTVHALAPVLAERQHYDEALVLLEQLVAGQVALYGADSRLAADALHELAVVQRDTGRTAEALANYRRSMEIYVRAAGPRDIRIAISHNNIGGALMGLGDPAAEHAFRESLAIRRERLQPADIAVARAEWALARWLLLNGRAGEARGLVDQADSGRAARLPPGHRDRIDSMLQQAQLALAEGRLGEAATQLRALPTPPEQLGAQQRMEHDHLSGQWHLAEGRPDEAVGPLRAARDRQRERHGPLHPDLARREVALAEALWGSGDAAGARASLAAAQSLLQRHHPQSPVRAATQTLAAAMAAREPGTNPRP
ncbi:MAG: protein kinase domain-containing protein [Aquabacterium sp.]